MLPEPTESLVAENGLGAEHLSGCEAFSAWNENRHPCFVCVFNMLDFIIKISMDIGRQVTPLGFLLDLVEKLKVCEVNEPRGDVFALEDLCCPFRVLPFISILSFPGSHTLSGICAARANRIHGS